MHYTIRYMQQNEYPLLEQLLYLAIYQPPGAEPLPFATIYQPEIHAYIKDFGSQSGDVAIVAAFESGGIAGAVWMRILAGPVRGFGNVDDKTPEFAIAIYPLYRGQGLGTALMQTACQVLRQQGYARATLSVNKANYAARMYHKVGFTVIAENEHDYLMEIRF